MKQKSNKQHTCRVNYNYFLIKQNEQQQNLKDLKKKRIIQTVWVNSTGYLLQLC